MRKLAEELVVGRVYADKEECGFLTSSYFRHDGRGVFTLIAGCEYEDISFDQSVGFNFKTNWYELTPEEDAIYNNKSTPRTFTEDEILKALEVVKQDARFISDEDSNYDKHWKMFRDKAIDIIHRELKLNKQ